MSLVRKQGQLSPLNIRRHSSCASNKLPDTLRNLIHLDLLTSCEAHAIYQLETSQTLNIVPCLVFSDGIQEV